MVPQLVPTATPCPNQAKVVVFPVELVDFPLITVSDR